MSVIARPFCFDVPLSSHFPGFRRDEFLYYYHYKHPLPYGPPHRTWKIFSGTPDPTISWNICLSIPHQPSFCPYLVVGLILDNTTTAHYTNNITKTTNVNQWTTDGTLLLAVNQQLTGCLSPAVCLSVIHCQHVWAGVLTESGLPQSRHQSGCLLSPWISWGLQRDYLQRV